MRQTSWQSEMRCNEGRFQVREQSLGLKGGALELSSKSWQRRKAHKLACAFGSMDVLLMRRCRLRDEMTSERSSGNIVKDACCIGAVSLFILTEGE